MARPYSKDLRERVVRSVEGGLSRRQAASLFGVAISTVIKWVGVWRATGSVAAKPPMGGDRNSSLKGERVWLLSQIEAVPDLTLEELRAELAGRGVLVGYGTVWRFEHRDACYGCEVGATHNGVLHIGQGRSRSGPYIQK
jgi:transposase